MNGWSGRRVLVTGAGGFIGSRLTERLVEEGASVRAFVRYTSSGTWGWLDRSARRAEVDVVAGDITEPEAVRTAARGMHVIFHLAASIGIPRSFEAPRESVRTNVEGTLNVLEAARDAGVERLVHTSTSEVYGTPVSLPITEAHPLQAHSPYAASKIGADKLVESFHRTFALPTVVLRPFNTYGPRQSQRAIIPNIIAQALTRAEIRLGALHPTRDLTFVDDTVDGFLAAGVAAAALGEVVQLGTGRSVAVADLARAILEVVGRDVPIVSDPARVRPGKSEVESLQSNPALAHKLLGWRAAHTLEEGLAKTVRWFREERTADVLKDGAYRV